MSRKGGSHTGGAGGVAMIPTGSRKMVDSLKEIVKNHPDSEIYAALKECNMDPNEAVSRLLSQDPFHEVKSKREKRKENKDVPESRPRGATSYGRGGKGSADRSARRGGSDLTSHTKSTPAYKENGFTAKNPTRVSSSATSRRLPTINDAVDTENKKTGNEVSPTPQHSSGFQPAWAGAPGKMSMADIVKMGKPHNKATNGSSQESWPQVNASSHSYVQWPSSSGGGDDHPSGQEQDWPSMEQPSAAARYSSVSDPPTSQLHPDQHHSQLEEVPESQFHDTDGVGSAGDSPLESDSLLDRKLVEDNSGGADNDLERYWPSPNNDFGDNEVEDADASESVISTNLQQISIQEEDEHGVSPERDGPSVVIPQHLQVQAADCLNLSFGSFGSRISSTTPSEDPTSKSGQPIETHVEDTSIDTDSQPVEDLRNSPGDILFHSTESVSGNYEPQSDPQPDSLKVEYADVAAQSNHYAYENSQSPNVAFTQSQPSTHTNSSPSFTNSMGYSNSLASNLLTTGRESEHSYSPFSSQAMPVKYSNSVSMPEALKSMGLSTQQNLAIHQHLALHPYSQQTLPVGPFANIISYPYMPQSYTIMSPGFQQSPFAAGNSSYQQSLAALLPQYKNSVSVSSLPPPAGGGVASGYGGGGFGNTSLGVDDGLSSRYKDVNHLMSLQQGDNSGMWMHGHGSRTMSAPPPPPPAANPYYNIQGHNQPPPPSGFRQLPQQPPSQSHASLGYPNFYHSQAGMSLDHHHHHHQLHHHQRDGSLPAAQSQQPPKPSSQQLWQNGY